VYESSSGKALPLPDVYTGDETLHGGIIHGKKIPTFIRWGFLIFS